MSGALHGLHAAHEARNERGEPLGIVHRDISPQNILVGTDGVPRVLDFGVAKAGGRIQTTREGQLKGKLAYMAPEQLSGQVTRQTDIYAAAVVLWEALAGKRLFSGENEAAILGKVLNASSRRRAPSSSTQARPSIRQRWRASTRSTRSRCAGSIAIRPNVSKPHARWPSRSSDRSGSPHLPRSANGSSSGASETLTSRAARIAEIESSSSVNAMMNLPSELMMKSSPPPPMPAERSSRDVVAASGEGSSSNSQLSSISLSKPGDGRFVSRRRRARPRWRSCSSCLR